MHCMYSANKRVLSNCLKVSAASSVEVEMFQLSKSQESVLFLARYNAIARQSVCPSVCPSATGGSVKTVEVRIWPIKCRDV